MAAPRKKTVPTHRAHKEENWIRVGARGATSFSSSVVHKVSQIPVAIAVFMYHGESESYLSDIFPHPLPRYPSKLASFELQQLLGLPA